LIDMNSTEKYYNRWIKNIAKRSSSARIKRHIIHHAKQLNDPKTNYALSWVSSMYNLLKIYETVHKVKSTVPIQIYKLEKKFNKNKLRNTPPPGNKIPKFVKVKKIKSNTSL
jgi:hypothetical protein